MRKQLGQAWGTGPGGTPFKAWRNDLYATARSVLDPSGTHLTYSSKNLTGGSDGQGVELGIKLGWTQPGQSGEGMVQVTVTSEGGTDDEQCVSTGGFGCPDTVSVDASSTAIPSA